MDTPEPKDLVVLVPCLDIRESIDGLLRRRDALGIRSVSWKTEKHALHESGVFTQCHDFLRSRLRLYKYALVICDWKGCRRESDAREDLECDIEERLRRTGWADRSAAVVIHPTVEVWFWAESPHVEAVLGWPSGQGGLRGWLSARGHLPPRADKPPRPEDAFKEALAFARKRHSASLFSQLAERVSLERCTDPAFLKLKSLLRAWFPPGAG
jgi:hypothetical protein